MSHRRKGNIPRQLFAFNPHRRIHFSLSTRSIDPKFSSVPPIDANDRAKRRMIVTLNNELDEVERKRCQHVKGILPISRVIGCLGYLVGRGRGGEQSCEVGNVNISQPCPYGGAKLPFLGYHRVALLSIRVQGAPKGCR